MNCPCCKDTVLQMSERLGIEIDYCPSCRGVWLDRGELDKIIEKSKPSSNFAHEAGPHSYNHNQYNHKRKKSFLEEMFD